MIRRRRRGAPSEQGSLIIAMAVVLVLSGLTLAILARTVSALGSARLSQDSAASVTAADAGVSDALYVLDSTDPTTPGNLTGTSSSFQWTASVAADLLSATITSTGTVNQRSQTVTVTASRRRRWPWVVATSGTLVLDGTDMMSSTLADPAKPALAAGGAMVVRDGASDGARQELLGPGASCSGCSDPVTSPVTTTLTDPVVPAATPPAPPGGCSSINLLPAGTYLCTGNVTFSPGVVTVGPGPVELYVFNNYGPPVNVTFTGASVNPGGDPSQFVLHIVGAGDITPGDGGGAGSFTGIIDAPRSSLRSSDCEFGLTGAADLGSFDCVTPAASPGPTLVYDARVAAVPATTWSAAGYQDASTP